MILEALTGCSFPSTRSLSWLKNPLTNRNLELDGYNEDLHIGFECNGEQHYIVVPRFHRKHSHYTDSDMEKELDLQIFRDGVKYIQCDAHSIDLIIIPYDIETWRLPSYIYMKLDMIRASRASQ